MIGMIFTFLIFGAMYIAVEFFAAWLFALLWNFTVTNIFTGIGTITTLQAFCFLMVISVIGYHFRSKEKD